MVAMVYRRYSKDNNILVLDMFGQGLSILRIAKALNVSPNSITKVIKSQFPDWDGRKVLPIKEIIKRYNDGETIESISLDLDVSHATIKLRLIAADIELRTQSEYQRIHFFNDDFFEVIDSESKAYWLGFLFADGNVSARMLDVAITLKQSDKEHLEKFGENINYSGPGIVMTVNSNRDGKNFKYSKVCLRSAKMALDLIDKGCIPNKSIDLDKPLNLPDKLNKHFVRGVVDGDGYISGLGYPSLEIVGAYGLLSWIADELGTPLPIPHKSIWRIRLNGKEAVAGMEYLYKDATMYLARKEERARNNYERL